MTNILVRSKWGPRIVQGLPARSRGEPVIERAVFLVLGVSCATCAPVIEKALQRLDGVVRVLTNYMLNTVYVDFDPERTTAATVARRIRKLGYRVVQRPAMPGPADS